jgi:hypothetical protein
MFQKYIGVLHMRYAWEAEGTRAVVTGPRVAVRRRRGRATSGRHGPMRGRGERTANAGVRLDIPALAAPIYKTS